MLINFTAGARMVGLFITGILLLVGCTAAQQPTDISVTAPSTAQGMVNISSPLTGSSIFAEALYVAGTADNLPQNRFQLRVISVDEELIAETMVMVTDGAWNVEIVHEYSGEPTEALIIAQSESGAEYDAESVLIASTENRPEGTFGAILSPQEDMVVGGDQIEVTGTGSGLFENTLILQLLEPDGTMITETIVTIENPYFIDERVWVADLETAGHTGPAIVRISYQDAASGESIILDEEEIMVSEVAG